MEETLYFEKIDINEETPQDEQLVAFEFILSGSSKPYMGRYSSLKKAFIVHNGGSPYVNSKIKCWYKPI